MEGTVVEQARERVALGAVGQALPLLGVRDGQRDELGEAPEALLDARRDGLVGRAGDRDRPPHCAVHAHGHRRAARHADAPQLAADLAVRALVGGDLLRGARQVDAPGGSRVVEREADALAEVALAGPDGQHLARALGVEAHDAAPVESDELGDLLGDDREDRVWVAFDGDGPRYASDGRLFREIFARWGHPLLAVPAEGIDVGDLPGGIEGRHRSALQDLRTFGAIPEPHVRS